MTNLNNNSNTETIMERFEKFMEEKEKNNSTTPKPVFNVKEHIDALDRAIKSIDAMDEDDLKPMVDTIPDCDSDDDDDDDEEGFGLDDDDIENLLNIPFRRLPFMEKKHSPLRDSDTEYHNMSVIHAKHNNYNAAIKVCNDGLLQFPDSTLLLADCMRYHAKNGDTEKADAFYRQLHAIPFKKYDVRTFEYVAEYLSEKKESSKYYHQLIAAFKKLYPYSEMPYFSEAMLEESLGNRKKATKILKCAVRRLSNASACALKLATIYIENGNAKAAKKITTYGFSASAQPKCSTNLALMSLIHILSCDALFHKKLRRTGKIDTAAAKALINRYNNFKENSLGEYFDFHTTICERISILNNLV